MQKALYVLAALVVLCLVLPSAVYAAQCEYVDDDEPKVDENGYIMSWLFLDPYINGAIGSTIAVAKDYFEDQGGEANLLPREGDAVTIAETGSEHVWTRLNFADLAEMGEIPAAVGGNEFDINCWGGQGVNNAQEYLVTYLKWKADTTVKFTFGSDDSSEGYLNGEELYQFAADINWAAGNAGSYEVDVKGGQWNVLVAGAYETGGEWGFSAQVDPLPDEIDNTGPPELFAVEPTNKLATLWGQLKR